MPIIFAVGAIILPAAGTEGETTVLLLFSLAVVVWLCIEADTFVAAVTEVGVGGRIDLRAAAACKGVFIAAGSIA